MIREVLTLTVKTAKVLARKMALHSGTSAHQMQFNRKPTSRCGLSLTWSCVCDLHCLMVGCRRSDNRARFGRSGRSVHGPHQKSEPSLRFSFRPLVSCAECELRDLWCVFCGVQTVETIDRQLDALIADIDRVTDEMWQSMVRGAGIELLR